LCKTRSSDSTHAKFDFEDPDQCEICQNFNPFNEEPVEGEEQTNDDEASEDSEDEEVDTVAKPVDPNAAAAADETPIGSYVDSCDTAEYKDGVLSTTCKNMGGQSVKTSLEFKKECEPKTTVSNSNGILQCDSIKKKGGKYLAHYMTKQAKLTKL